MQQDQMTDMLCETFGFQAEWMRGRPTNELIALARESLEVIETTDRDPISVSRAGDHAGRLMGIAMVLTARCAVVEDRLLRDG